MDKTAEGVAIMGWRDGRYALSAEHAGEYGWECLVSPAHKGLYREAYTVARLMNLLWGLG